MRARSGDPHNNLHKAMACTALVPTLSPALQTPSTHTKGRGFDTPLSRNNGFDLGPARTCAESLTHASLLYQKMHDLLSRYTTANQLHSWLFVQRNSYTTATWSHLPQPLALQPSKSPAWVRTMTPALPGPNPRLIVPCCQAAKGPMW